MITTKILADSINPAGHRITTWELTHPRYIHAEFLRHRMLALNAASSRAIPAAKMIQAVRENPALFEQYGRANKGMQAQELMEDGEIAVFEDAWREAGKACAAFAEDWGKDVAKQIVNRILEPWAHMTVIVTGTDWHNFYALRAHPHAQPEFQVLAYRMLAKYLESTPNRINWGAWHLPLVEEEEAGIPAEELPKVSAGRCARVSYNRHTDYEAPEKSAERCVKLITDGHMSPTEHPAMAWKGRGSLDGPKCDDCGCYTGWKPYRKMLPNENRTSVDLAEILANKPDWITL